MTQGHQELAQPHRLHSYSYFLQLQVAAQLASSV